MPYVQAEGPKPQFCRMLQLDPFQRAEREKLFLQSTLIVELTVEQTGPVPHVRRRVYIGWVPEVSRIIKFTFRRNVAYAPRFFAHLFRQAPAG